MFSVDFQRYYRSEIKERNAKLVDRVFLESSWDCLMNIPHNMESNRTEDYSRDCEYDVCNYSCYGISADTVPSSDFANANQFYSEEEQWQILSQIKSFFSQQSSILLKDFYQLVSSHNHPLVEKCLDYIIHQPILLRDYRNLPCFLTYKNGILFLTDNPYLPVSKENYELYYQQHPATRVMFALPELLDDYFTRHEKTILPKLIRLITMDSPNAKKLFLSLPLSFQSLFCETTIQSQLENPTHVDLDARGWFVREFKTDISYIPNVLIEHRFVQDKQHPKRLDLKNLTNGWVLL
jgi:hypothetical protein